MVAFVYVDTHRRTRTLFSPSFFVFTIPPPHPSPYAAPKTPGKGKAGTPSKGGKAKAAAGGDGELEQVDGDDVKTPKAKKPRRSPAASAAAAGEVGAGNSAGPGGNSVKPEVADPSKRGSDTFGPRDGGAGGVARPPPRIGKDGEMEMGVVDSRPYDDDDGDDGDSDGDAAEREVRLRSDST